MSRLINRLRGRVYGWFDSKDAEVRPFVKLPNMQARLVLQDLEDRFVPTTFWVTNTNDNGAGSLRQAVLDASASSGNDIAFNADNDPGETNFSTGINTIILNSGLVVSSTSTNGTGFTLTGPGADKLVITRASTAPAFRFLDLGVGNNTYTISDLTVRNMSTNIIGGVINFRSLNTTSSLTLLRTNISGTTVAAGFSGGVLYHRDGTLNLTDVTISGTSISSSVGGGALRVAATAASTNTINITNSTITNNINTSTGPGTAILLSTFTGTLNITNSTIVNNSAAVTSTVAGNGGGISRTATTALTVNIQDSIIADNSTAQTSNKLLDIAFGTTGSTLIANNSLIGSTTGIGGTVTIGSSNKTGTNTAPLAANLSVLGYQNIGSTPVRIPLASSAANNNGSATPVAMDQAKVSRANPSDIGAVEIPAVPYVMAPSLADVFGSSGGTSYAFSVNLYPGTGPAIDATSLGNGDFIITGPNSFSTSATFVGYNSTTGVADYKFTPPGGSWNPSENGIYSIATAAGQILNTSAGAAPATFEGGFGVFVVDPITYTVTSLDDSGPGTLRQAILDANANAPAADIIQFQSGLVGTITIPGGGSGQMTISDSLTINGPSTGGITINGSGVSRHFNITGPGTLNVTLRNLTLENGAGGTGASTNVFADGGSIVIADETVLIEDSVLTGNSTTSSSLDGGAIDVAAGANLTIRRSTLTGNGTNGPSAGGDGGAIYVGAGGNVTIEASTISGNSATGRGGAIYFDPASTGSTLIVANSTISGNMTSSAAGSGGGGIFIQGTTGTVSIRNSTIVDNIADATGTGAGVGGGGIANTSTTVGFSIESSIIARNSSANGRPDISAATTGGFSLIRSAVGDGTGFTLSTNTGNIAYGTNLKLATTAALNGGTTLNFLPDADSPLIDKGSNTFTYSSDQRGVARVNVIADIGSVEAGFISAPIATPTTTNVGIPQTGLTTYTFTVEYKVLSGSIQVSTLDNNDIRVIGPSFNTLATFVSVDNNSPGSPRVATYSFTAPANPTAGWDGDDNGTYTLNMELNQVTTVSGTPVESGVIGSFVVVLPRTFTVTSDGESGPGTLRQALEDAALPANPLADTIVFDPTFASTTNIIELAGTELLVNSPVTIVGPGANKLTVDGNALSRVFNITDGSTATSLNITITGLSITGGSVTGAGGGVQTNNEIVTFNGVHIHDNNATTDGGGIATADGAQITLLNSAVTGNVAASSGGGAYINLSATSVILVRNSTIANNVLNGTVGGAGFDFGAAAGAVVTFENSTVTGNTATGSGADGGGIRFSSATGAVLDLVSTVVAGNGFGTGTAFGADIALGTAATTVGTVNATKSLIGSTDGYILGTDSNNVAPGTKALLGTLADNGGPVPTILPLAGSPLINKGSNPQNLTTDARGASFPRERPTGAPDIGAVEFFSTSPVAILGSLVNVTPANAGANSPYVFTVQYSTFDTSKIDHTTIQGDEIKVTRTNSLGFDVFAELVSVNPSTTDASVLTATYKVTPTGGTWDGTETGRYNVSILGNQVKTTPGSTPIATADLGAFFVLLGGTFAVTNTGDNGGVNPEPFANTGTLRQALVDANFNNSTTDEIVFESSVFNTPQTITVSTAIAITDSVTISGAGKALLTVSGGGTAQLFTVNNGTAGTAIDVTFKDMTLSGGMVTGSGGAVQIQDENVTFRRVVLSGNTASVSGGAIHVTLPNTNALLIEDSILSTNSAGTDGGAINVLSPTATKEFSLTIRNTSLTENTSNDDGGAISMGTSSTVLMNLLVERSTLSGNVNGLTSTTGDGGALYFRGTVGSTGFFIRNSTVSGNSANTTGNNSVNGGGLALPLVNGTFNIQNSTIVNNTSVGGISLSGQAGGGIAINGTGSKLVIESSVVAGNSSNAGRPDIASETPVTLLNSAVGIGTGFTLAPTSGKNVGFGVDLKLNILTNGVHTPQTGSPLLDRGSNPASLTTDQLGNARTVGLTDIGSVEAGQAAAPFGLLAFSTPVVNATTATFTVTYYDASGINVSTLDSSDIRITGGPNGLNALATFVSVDNNSPGSPRTATYSFTVPDGVFSDNDNGTYVFTLEPNQVKNSGGAAAPTEIIGNFTLAYPGTITVTRADDVTDPNDGLLTLREAIELANTNPSADSIQFSSLFNTPHTISLTSGQITITGNTIIEGPGAKLLAIDAVNTSRHFFIDDGITDNVLDVTIRGMKLYNGQVSGTTGTAAAGRGGSINHGEEKLTLDGMWLTNNTTDGAGGAVGGGKVAVSAIGAGYLYILNSTISNNSARGGDSIMGGGGVLFHRTLDGAIRNSTIAGNTVGGTTIGGGGTSLTSPGGGIVIYGAGSGTILIESSTIADNSSNSTGPGISAGSGVLTLLNTIVANNTGSVAQQHTGSAFTANHSAFSSSAAVTGANNIAPTALDLGTLQDNGGSTPTIALGATSTAIDAGSPTSAFTTDQRGGSFARVSGAATDIGAFEVQAVAFPAVSSISVNQGAVGGSTQRSRVTSITVTFASPLTAGNITTLQTTDVIKLINSESGVGTAVVRTGGAGTVLDGTITVTATPGTNTAVLTFAGTAPAGPNDPRAVDFGSLSDGRWRLEIDSTPGGAPEYVSDGSVPAQRIRRLFGDINGDGTVDGGTDSASFAIGNFQNVIGLPPGTTTAAFDFNNDGTIDGGTDFAEFGSRFGRTV